MSKWDYIEYDPEFNCVDDADSIYVQRGIAICAIKKRNPHLFEQL